MEKNVLAIGRWMPIHLGHKEFLVNLANNYDKLVIGIGSCYENGTPRNCIPAVIREKLLRKIFKTEGIPDEKIEIVQIKDSDTFEEWIDDVIKVCKAHDITHFCTGNREDIINVLEEKGIDLNLKMINPETNSSFPFHATDIRNAILNGEYDKINEMIPAEIKDMVIENVSKEIIAANKGEGKKFIPGRQTVDLAFFVKNKNDGKDYVLIGKRKKEKIDFPNVDAIPGSAIKEFESPVNAALRTFYNETGLKAKIIDNSEEPATIIMQPELSNKKEKMNFIGIYASPDERVNGSRGGGTQCFSIYIDGDIEKIKSMLQEKSDLENSRFVPVEEIPNMELAFEQKDMIIDACDKLKIDYLKEEKLAVLDEKGYPTGEAVSRKKAHEEGILHGASHIYIYRRNDNGEIDILLQRRSHNKDSFPDCLDISSAGHMEQGMSFRKTALKELSEELGIKIDNHELEKAFLQRFSNVNNFKGKIFNNQEINTIYLLEKDLDISKLKLQKEEVSEVVWRNSKKILDDLKKEYSEYCLDIKEYKKVLEKIKEKSIDKGKDGKKMSDDNFELKEVYENAIIEGKIKESIPAERAYSKKRNDGESAYINIDMTARIAASLAEKNGCDRIIASSIATALQSSSILYGDVGEKVLQSIMEREGESFSRREYSEYIVREMLRTYNGRKKEAIIQGVLDAIDNTNNKEANAAKAAILSNELLSKSYFQKEKHITQSYLDGEIIEFERVKAVMDKSVYGEKKTQEIGKELIEAYNYLKKHPQLLGSRFGDVSDSKKVIYYIADLGVDELGRVLDLAKEQKEI